MLVNVFSLNYTYGALKIFQCLTYYYYSYRKSNLRAFSPAAMSQHHIWEKQKNIELPSSIELVRKKKDAIFYSNMSYLCASWSTGRIFPFSTFSL